MNKRYYKKKGPSYKERLRCPLCGKLSAIGFFSQRHQFGIYRYTYGGKGDISVKLILKTSEFMKFLRESLIDRFLELLQGFAGCRYYSQYDVDELVDYYKKLLAKEHFIPPVRPVITPSTTSTARPNTIIPQKPIMKPIVKPYKVVIE